MLREAAKVIEAGWSVGAAARDAAGNQVPLFVGERSAVNPAAVSFSLYGAIVKAGRRGAANGQLWHVLLLLAEDVLLPRTNVQAIDDLSLTNDCFHTLVNFVQPCSHIRSPG